MSDSDKNVSDDPIVGKGVCINKKTPRYTFVPGSFYYLEPPLGGRGSFISPFQ